MMRIVIIEDEKLTAEDLVETILALDKNIEIVAVLKSIKEAIVFFQENAKVDLIFSDIQLGDGLSFEIFKTVQINTPVVFCTAYDEYALKAFKANGIDYVLKPFTKDTIENALSRFRELKHNFLGEVSAFDKIATLFETRKDSLNASVLVYSKDKIVPINISDIAVFYIEDEITHLFTFDRKSHSIKKTLEELERFIGPNFYRANRKFLINRKAIVDASQYFHRKLQVNLTVPFKTEEPITVSKVKVTEFLNWLSGN